jgi:hypothetical protein
LFLQTKCHDIKDICFFKLSVCGGIRNSTDTSIATIQLKPYVRWFILPSKNGIMALLRHSILRQSLLRHSILRQSLAGADPGFQVRGGTHLKKLRRAEGGANIFGVFRVKNHDSTPRIIFFKIIGDGGRATGAPP